MKKIQAGPKPTYIEWLKYIHKEVKKQIIDWPKTKAKTAAEIELQKLYDQRKKDFKHILNELIFEIMIKVRDFTDTQNSKELTEKEMFKKMDFSDAKRFIEAKHPKKELNEIEREINGIENELTLIRLSQLSIEHKLNRLKILAKKQ